MFFFSLQDVFIFDTKQELFVWVGKQTTHEERRNAMTYAHVRGLCGVCLSVCLKIHDAHLVPHLGLVHIYYYAHRLYFYINNQSLRTIVQLFWISLQNIRTFVTACLTQLFSPQIFAALHQQQCGLYIGKR